MMKSKLKRILGLALASLMLLTMSVTALAAESDSSDCELQEIYEVVENEAPTVKQELEETFEVYDEHEGNGLLISPTPISHQTDVEDEEDLEETGQKAETEKKGFFQKVADFFNNLIDELFGKK